MTDTELLNLVLKALPYTPIVYKQSIYATEQNEFGNNFILEFKYTDIEDDSLLFFLPSVSSNESENCKLTIKIPTVKSDGTIQYTSKVFAIIVEQNDDLPRPASKGDIIANRMCIFRFRKTKNQVILCNSPLYNDAIFSKVKIVNGEFINLPKYLDPENPTISYTLVSTKELSALEQRVYALEERVKFGVEEPEEALKDLPSGTIYIQYEKD